MALIVADKHVGGGSHGSAPTLPVSVPQEWRDDRYSVPRTDTVLYPAEAIALNVAERVKVI